MIQEGTVSTQNLPAAYQAVFCITTKKPLCFNSSYKERLDQSQNPAEHQSIKVLSVYRFEEKKTEQIFSVPLTWSGM